MNKIVFTALAAGIIAGIFVFAVQSFKLTPLILQAEGYEEAAAAKAEAEPHTHQDAHAHAHAHAEGAWEPANGLERDGWRLVANIGMGFGFALMLIGAIALRGEAVDARKGIVWGMAGFAVFSLAPGFGLPPELPTTLAAELEARQIWWIGTATATALGLYLMVFSTTNLWRAAGLIALAVPHIIGAPEAPLGGIVPTELNAEFASASLTTMALFWVVLGAASGWLYGKRAA